MHFMSTFLVAFTDNTAHPFFVIYYFMTIMIPLAVLIRPYRPLCIDSIKGSVSDRKRRASFRHHVSLFSLLPPSDTAQL